LRCVDLTFVVGLGALAAFTEHAARAADVAANLEYRAEPACPAAREFESVVARHLGYSPFRDDAAERVVVQIEASARGLEGRLEWRKAAGALEGERTFPSRTGDCAELVRAMGFALAVQFQLLATAAEPAGPAVPPPTPPAAPVVIASPGPPPASAAPGASTSSGPSLAAGAGASGGLGVSPEATVLGRVFGSATWSHAELELATEISVPSTTRRADGAGFSHQVFLASLAGCGVLSRVGACVVGKIGELRVTGDGVDTPATASGLVLQTGLRLAVTQMLGQRLFLLAHVDTVASLTRGVVTLDAMPVWTTPRVAASFGLDLALRFL